MKLRMVAVAMAALLAALLPLPGRAAGAFEAPIEPSFGPDVSTLVPEDDASGLVEPDAYIVGPGDIFILSLSGRVSRTTTVRVSPEGSILISGWPSMVVAGLTLRNARERVLDMLHRDLHGVEIDFQLARVRRIRVQVVGDVRTVFSRLVYATSRVSDALPESLLTRTASHRRIEVRRRDGTIAIADLDFFLRTGRSDTNPFLRDGDIVFVPPATEFIEIYGAVAHSAHFELGLEDSLRTLFVLAGGVLPSASNGQALLVRWRTPNAVDSLWFSIDSTLARISNPLLRNGDRVYVYFTPAYHELEQVTLEGEFERPGIYPLSAGVTRLTDLVQAAGGFRARADLSNIRLTRASANIGGWKDDVEFQRLSHLARSEMTTGEYVRLRTNLVARRRDYRLNWSDIQKHPELNLLLAAGDTIRVDPVLATVRVDGEVRHPGAVDYFPGRSPEAYVALAGGYTDRAVQGRILVTRAVAGHTLSADQAAPIQAGDLLWVPEISDKSLLERLLPFVTLVAQVATIYLVFRR